MESPTNKQIITGSAKVLWIILLLIGNCIGFWQLFGWMSLASTTFNILGFLGVFVLLVVNILIIKAVLKTHTQK